MALSGVIPRLSCDLLLKLKDAKAKLYLQDCILFPRGRKQPAFLRGFGSVCRAMAGSFACCRCQRWLLVFSAAKAPLSNGLGRGQPCAGCQARRSCSPGPLGARLGASPLLIGLSGSR